MDIEKNTRRKTVVVNLDPETHRYLRVLSALRGKQIKEMTDEAFEDYFTKAVGSNWREKLAMDN